MTKSTATTTETPGAATGGTTNQELPATYRPFVMPTVVDPGVAAPVVSVKPVVLAAPGRGADLHLRVSAPATGQELPVILFSHGNGSSLEGYGPLTDFWAGHGFVVVQPTHLDSRMVSVPPDDPRVPDIWRFRVEDLTRILDQLDLVEAAVPGLAGRLDRRRVAVAGHSFGGASAASLLGSRLLDSDGKPGADLSDSRVTAGMLLATAGTGGADLTPYAAEHFPFMNPSFDEMTTPTFVIAGDQDYLPMTVRGPDWCTDSYFLSPGAESLLTVFGAKHLLGGISGYEVAETTDENPARVALIQQLTWAYLRHALGIDDDSWQAGKKALAADPDALGRIESK